MPQTASLTSDDVVALDDELWEELIELTDGAAAVCYQCGVCTATCPWGLVRQKPLSVRTFMREAQLGLQNGSKPLWLCTTCAQCEAYCPRGVDITGVFRGLRSLAWKRNQSHHGLPTLLWSVYWNNNPWEQPPSQRSQWAKKLDIPIFDPHQHEILFYVGCTSSYDSRAQKIAIALVRILKAARVEFGFLGDDEPCCGEAVLSVGHKPYFDEVAQQTAQVFREKGVTQLVTISPHCYDVFKNHYPPFVEQDFTPIHYTQYLAQLMDEGRLNVDRPLDARVAFQDPCYLGRHNSEYESPRRVLASIPGIEVVEMANSTVNGLCCGGGGGRMWLETAAGERFSDLRVTEAMETGAGILATACPFCLACLEDSVKGMKAEDLTVLDVAEIVAAGLHLSREISHGKLYL
ncbi:MAG: (Fe-S)-binding protein [Anaerolineales bacterium]